MDIKMKKEKRKIKFKKILYILISSLLMCLFIITNAVTSFCSTSTKTTVIGAIDNDYLAEEEVDGGFLSDYNLTKMAKIEGSEEEGYYFTFNEEAVKEILDITLFDQDVRYRDWGTTDIDALMQFIETEIFTGLPNISKDPENIKTDGDKIQGAVKFKRQSFDIPIGEYAQAAIEDELTEADTSTHIIAIDAGHGNLEGGQVTNSYDNIATSEEELNNGKAKFTRGNSGEDSEGNEYKEWELNQKVVDLVIEKLSSYPTIKIIQTGKDMPDYQRLQTAIDAGAEAYISVHFNDKNSTRGTEVWASATEYTENGEKVELGDNTESINFGTTLMNSISGQMNMGVTTSKVREYYKEIKSTLKTSEECGIPNVYVFGNNMATDVLDELMKDDEQGLDDYAQGIVNGILEYYDSAGNTSETGEVNANVNERYLRYTSPENFDNMINNGDENVLEYFTLDDDMKMIIATWTYSDGVGAVFRKAAANEYTTKIKPYIMPYQYPLAFLQDTGAEKFSKELARLSLDSDLIMTVFDNVTSNSDKVITTVTTENQPHSWTMETTGAEGDFPHMIEESYGDVESTTEEPDVDTTTTEISSATLELTYADAWCVEYEKFYQDEYKDTTFIPVGEPQITESPVSFSETTSSTETSDTGSTLTHYEYTIQKTITKVENQNRKVTYKFIENPNREPVLSGNTSKFVKLLRKHTSTALTNIESDNGEGLITILANRAATANMVELTKWLLQETSKSIYFGLVKYEFEEFDPANFTQVVGGGTAIEGGLSLHTTMFTKEVFIQALQSYYDKTGNQAFYNNFLLKAEELYDASIANNVNPELVVITAKTEGNFEEAGGSYNYWGVNVPNGASSGDSYSSLSDGIRGYAQYINKYETDPEHVAVIMQRYEERKAAGCNPNGYGLPGTLAGMQSRYSWLGDHVEGSAGTGGYYYMDPDRAGVTAIYSTHQEFLDKCYNAGGEHAYGTVTTVWEQGQYTAWQVESKLDVWEAIFGDFGSLTSAGTTSSDGGTVYYQGDYDYPYGDDTIAGSGCGPTSFAMIASDYLGRKITPIDAVSWCGNSYYVAGVGTSWSYFSAAASHFSLPCTVIQTSSIDTVIQELQNGNLAISSQAPGLFTSSAHFIVLSSVDSSGGIRVRDPNGSNAVGKGYENRTFTTSEIDSTAKSYWIFKRN